MATIYNNAFREFGWVYGIINEKLQVAYIGITNRDVVGRWYQHMRKGLEIKKFIETHGMVGFSFMVLESDSKENPINIFDREKYWYEVYKGKGYRMLNLDTFENR